VGGSGGSAFGVFSRSGGSTVFSTGFRSLVTSTLSFTMNFDMMIVEMLWSGTWKEAEMNNYSKICILGYFYHCIITLNTLL
jgi:hypothetical protein